MILTMTIIPMILIIIFIILPMMLVILPAVSCTQEEPDVFLDDTTMNTVSPPTVSMTTALVASPSSTPSYKKSGKRKEL